MDARDAREDTDTTAAFAAIEAHGPLGVDDLAGELVAGAYCEVDEALNRVADVIAAGARSRIGTKVLRPIPDPNGVERLAFTIDALDPRDANLTERDESMVANDLPLRGDDEPATLSWLAMVILNKPEFARGPGAFQAALSEAAAFIYRATVSGVLGQVDTGMFVAETTATND